MNMQPLSIPELEARVKQELHNSGNFAGSEWRDAIRVALDYFLGKPKGDDIDGRSKLQSGDVADIIDHVQAELQPMYNVDILCEVGEEGPNDENATIETEALNWYWRERLRGAEIVDEAVQDGLLSRNGYLKVWFEQSYGFPFEETFEGDEMQIRAALMKLSETGEYEIDMESMRVSQVSAAIVVQPDPIAQELAGGVLQPLIQQPAQYSITVKVTPVYREVKMESPAPEDMFISRDAVGSNMQKPRYVAQLRRETRQGVIGLGFYTKDVMEMPRDGATYNSDVNLARQSDNNRQYDDSADTLGQMVQLFESYYQVDYDRDGVTELLKIFHSKTGTILRWSAEDPETGEEIPGEYAVEMVRSRPFASGSPMKVSHRHQGRSLFDKEKDIEDWGRVLIRQMADNLVEANNATTIYKRGGVDEEDMEDTDVGRFIGADNPPTDVVFAKHNNIVGDSLQGLVYKDKIRRERGGSTIDASHENMPVSQAAHSTERVMSAMERRVAMYARNFANNMFRDAFVLLHEQLKLWPGKMAFESGNQWRETEPRYWIQRNRISVNLGESEGDRLKKGAALGAVIANQREDAGKALTEQEYEARVDQARMAGLKDPGQYYLDPRSPKGRQLAAQQAEQAQVSQQMAFQQSQALYQTQLAMTQMQEQTKRMSDQLDAINSERDRLNKLIIEMSKLEADTGQEIPFGLLGENDSETMVQ